MRCNGTSVVIDLPLYRVSRMRVTSFSMAASVEGERFFARTDSAEAEGERFFAPTREQGDGSYRLGTAVAAGSLSPN